MTDTPMTQDRERMIRMRRTHCEASRFETEDERPLHEWGPSQYPTQEMCQRCTVMRWWAEEPDTDEAVLLAEVDRLRAELVEDDGVMRALRRQRDAAESRLAATERLVEEARDKGNHTVDTNLLLDALRLDGAPADEAADLAQALANLEAMRVDHPAPCRVPDSPDCTCPDEHPMDRATDLGVTRIPENIVIELREATNTGRPTGWHVWVDRDGDIWEVTDETYDGDTVLMPRAGDMRPMLRRDVERHFGPLAPKADS
ncbi:hypothetical protein ACWCXC_31525 [Streptomyces sp. NPDC001515]